MESGNTSAKYSVGVGVGKTWGGDKIEWKSASEANNRPTENKEEGDP